MFISFPISDEDDRKLFVGHLGQEVNEKDIKKYFMKYGKVVDVDLKRNVNGSSRREYITSILLFNLFSSNLVLNYPLKCSQVTHLLSSKMSKLGTKF